MLMLTLFSTMIVYFRPPCVEILFGWPFFLSQHKKVEHRCQCAHFVCECRREMLKRQFFYLFFYFLPKLSCKDIAHTRAHTETLARLTQVSGGAGAAKLKSLWRAHTNTHVHTPHAPRCAGALGSASGRR